MAQVDLTCLRILREREDYDRLRRIIPEALLDPATDTILKDYGRYFKDNPDEERINLESFKSMFFGFWHPKLSPEQKTHYNLVLKQALKESVPDSIRQNFVSNIVEQDYAAKMAELLTKYNDGGDVNITREIGKLIERAETDLEKKSDIQFVDDDIGDLLSADEDVRGVRWRLRCLQESIRPMASGDFGLVCGRPDTGKTTFLTDNLTYMAPQLPEAFPDREEPFILWLNNEGPGRRIKPRLYQSAVGLSLPECVALHKKGKLVDAYIKAVGALNRIRILDIHGWNHYDVEDVIKQTRPCIIVFDMIDNIRFAGMAQGSRTDQALEAMYQEAREWCVKYGAIGLATSQISNEGDGLLFPTISMLKDSKCFAAGEPIRMFDGSIKPIEEITVGEQVMGIDGTARTVTATGSGEEEMYRVSGKGWHFDCNESHNLVVQNPTAKFTAGLHKGEVRDLSLREFMKHPSYMQRLAAVRCRIPYREADLPMDPYLFGLWLGDGSARECRITSGDQEILTYLEGLPTYRSTYKQESNCSDVYFGPRGWLDSVGVRGNKHIPQMYKTSSVEQRLSLLAGLMDSDGTVDHGGSVITMSLKRAGLVEDIAEVARSLGYRTSVSVKSSNNSMSVAFAPTEALPCLLGRKVHVCKPRHDTMKVEPIGWGKYYGITVDGDSRYCHAKYIALRNTGKQGAVDFQIMLGRSNDFNSESLRGIGVVKNKLRVPGQPGDPRAEVFFDGNGARYMDAD